MVGSSGRASGLMSRQELLFDSTGLVDLYRGQVALQPYLNALLNRDINAYISVITEAELWRGLRAESTTP